MVYTYAHNVLIFSDFSDGVCSWSDWLGPGTDGAGRPHRSAVPLPHTHSDRAQGLPRPFELCTLRNVLFYYGGSCMEGKGSLEPGNGELGVYN